MVKYLTKSMLSTGGAAVSHHGIARFDLAADLTTLLVHLEQWPDEAARVAGASATGRWLVRLEVAALSLAEGLEAAVQAGVLQDEAFAGGAWAPGTDATVATAKARQWAAIKAERARRLAGTFSHGGHVYDLNPVNMSGAVIDAMRAQLAAEPWTQLWVLADNTAVTLSAADMIAVGQACKAAVSGLWATSQALRVALDAIDDETGTLAEVAAVQWPA